MARCRLGRLAALVSAGALAAMAACSSFSESDATSSSADAGAQEDGAAATDDAAPNPDGAATAKDAGCVSFGSDFSSGYPIDFTDELAGGGRLAVDGGVLAPAVLLSQHANGRATLLRQETTRVSRIHLQADVTMNGPLRDRYIEAPVSVWLDHGEGNDPRGTAVYFYVSNPDWDKVKVNALHDLADGGFVAIVNARRELPVLSGTFTGKVELTVDLRASTVEARLGPETHQFSLPAPLPVVGAQIRAGIQWAGRGNDAAAPDRDEDVAIRLDNLSGEVCH